MTRRYDQLSNAFARTLFKDGVTITFARGNASGSALAVFTEPRHDAVEPDGFTTIVSSSFFLMQRSAYRFTGQAEPTMPMPGDVITNTITQQQYVVIPKDDSRKVDDTHPQIDKIRIPVKRIGV